MTTACLAGVLLYWLPLGAGGHFVRWNGRLYEALAARRDHRAARDLYHSALEVRLDAHRYVIEMAPVWTVPDADRGVVRRGPVGARWLGCSAAFRYEVRRWRMGRIPDAAEAVDSPRLVSRDADRAERLLELVPQVPALTWGRDELRTGDMWNSNSLISWLLARSGHDLDSVALPAHGRAPGWEAGWILAERQLARARTPTPRSWSSGWREGPWNGHKGNHNSKIAMEIVNSGEAIHIDD
jgi:hypothetical protein